MARTGIVSCPSPELLVVERVFREGRELAAEGVWDRERAGVDGCVVVACRLLNRSGVGGQFVVESVEQDALAAGDQTLDVGAAEIEVPHFRIF